MLDPVYTKQRQSRLLAAMHDLQLDAIVLTQPHHVYYASGHRPFWLHSAGFVLFADGRTWLTTGNSPDTSAVADDMISFEASWMGTQRQEQPSVAARQIQSILNDRRARRVGVDASDVNSQLVMQFSGHFQFQSIDEQLWQLRRSKWPDELALMRRAIDCTTAMYDVAREIIEPGLPEVELFAKLHAAAVKESGEPMTAHLGNDYACGVGGGPPRKDHSAQAGQLWILDLGPSYRGYFADNARVFSVGRNPTDIQHKAWEAMVSVFPIIEQTARRGVKCQELFRTVDAHLKSTIGQGLAHHLGHGVGLQPHEFPHLNLKWDDTLIEGEIFTVEPGIYSEEINGGIRVENQYRVTATGVENLVDYPLKLA